MRHLILAAATLALLATPVLAQDRHDDHHDNNTMMMAAHHDWHKGDRIGASDWGRGERISDYGHYHLRRPPRGYEWRRVDNNYVLAAVAGGVIASVIAASH